jgi:hypothetical protein
MEDIMDIIHVTNKGKMMDTLERYYIYKGTVSNNQINDKLTTKPNPIFEAVIHKDSCRGHADSQHTDDRKITQLCGDIHPRRK